MLTAEPKATRGGEEEDAGEASEDVLRFQLTTGQGNSRLRWRKLFVHFRVCGATHDRLFGSI
jgi:hypothetical protein